MLLVGTSCLTCPIVPRFARLNARDKENNEKLISKLNELDLEKTAAF